MRMVNNTDPVKTPARPKGGIGKKSLDLINQGIQELKERL